MAKQITDNASKSPVAGADVLLVRDVTANADKKTTVAGLAPAVAANVPDGGLSSVALTNPYKFRVYRTAAFNLTGGTHATVPYDTKTFDTGSNVDIVVNKGRFTATVAGTYFFSATCSVAASGSTQLVATITKNGSIHSSGNSFYASVPVPSFIASSVSDEVQLAIGDYAEIRVYCNGSAAIDPGSPANYFSGHFVSK